MPQEPIQLLDLAIGRCEVRLSSYKDKYGLATETFLAQTAGGELQQTDDFADWVGESRMLAGLRAKPAMLQGIESVN